MTADFQKWLNENNLEHLFTTPAGDSFWANREKKFGVLQRNGEIGASSFYLDDIMEITTYDDENTLVHWSSISPWRVMPRQTIHSSYQFYTMIKLKNQLELRIQIYRSTDRNVVRNSDEFHNIANYALQISQCLYGCAYHAAAR